MSNYFIDADKLGVGERLHFHDDGSLKQKELLQGLHKAYPTKKFHAYGHGGEIWIIRHG